ncbi:MSRA-like protein, partial [Mya arenaria]
SVLFGVKGKTGGVLLLVQSVLHHHQVASRDEAIKVSRKHAVNGNPTMPPFPDEMQMAMFGYTKNPTYKEVCSGNTGHNEVFRVVFDPANISYGELLKVFWESHNPTQLNRQGNDWGTQYRSGIYYYSDEQRDEALASKDEYEKLLIAKGYDKIATEIKQASEFYYAEDYHQQYLHKNPDGYCGLGGTGVSCPIGLGVSKKKQGKSDL